MILAPGSGVADEIIPGSFVGGGSCASRNRGEPIVSSAAKMPSRRAWRAVDRFVYIVP
jgi:hypothetical protein